MNNMESLIGLLQQRAEFFLRENGEFAPFGAYVRSNGEITDIASYSESTSSEEMYNILLKGVAQDLQDEDIRASAIALDGKYKGKNVLVIEIFLSEEDKYQAIYPYNINDGKVTFEKRMQ